MFNVRIWMETDAGPNFDDDEPLWERNYWELFDAQTVALIEFRDLLRTNAGQIKTVTSNRTEYGMELTTPVAFTIQIVKYSEDEEKQVPLRPVNVVQNRNCDEWMVIEA